MTNEGAISILLYMKHDVLANSSEDVALDMAIESLKSKMMMKTNGGRIRQMTDEELVMAVDTSCNRCASSETCELRGDPVNYGICVKGNLAWLKQECDPND